MSTDAKLLQADSEARATALDVSRSFVVQAPAGSGKTELLIQRFLKLLTIVDAPEEVLAITFTRKAAAEMRLRVVSALRGARDRDAAKADHEKITQSIAAEVLAKDQELSWQLLQSPGRLRIETVDAFSAGIARSLPLSSGLGGVTSTIADSSMNAIYRAAAAGTLDWLPSASSEGESVQRVLRHLDNNTQLYIDYLARMLASREQWLEIVGSGDLSTLDATATREHLESNIAGVVRQHLGKLSHQLPAEYRNDLLTHLRYAAQNLCKDNKPDHLIALFADKQDLPDGRPEECLAWQAIANLLLVKTGNWRKSINKNDGFPSGDDGQKQNLYELIGNLQDVAGLGVALHRVRLLPEPRYSDEQWAVLLALFKLLPLAVAQLRTFFSERGVTDHAEISMAARRALGSPEEPGEIALLLDYRIRHLLVDEMQDTSISQYELLKTVTAGWLPEDGRTAFCVGDPMQSVYRFRDAEVGEFLQTRRNGLGTLQLESLQLRRNFRSGEFLVHWFNTVFSQVMPRRDDVSVGAIAYTESVPVEQHAGIGECHVYPLFDASAEREAQKSVSVIRKCIAENPGESLAVLVRSRTQLPQLLAELRKTDTPYQAMEIDRLTDLPEVIEVIAVTRAICDENDRLAWLAMLRAPWVGLSWDDIHQLVRNDSGRTVLELVNDSQRLAKLSGVGQERLVRFLTVIKSYIERHATRSLRDKVECAWLELGGAAMLQNADQVENVYRLFDVLENISTAGTLEDVHELENLLENERVSSSDADGSLQIMTMHKAKGLQFDHVLLHGLGRMSRAADNEVLSWLTIPNESAGSEMLISPVGPRYLVERNPLHRYIAATDAEKDKAELDRLLYVACTRAKKSLHLVGGVGVSSDGEKFLKPNSRSALNRLWPALESIFVKAFEHHEDIAAENDEASRSHLVAPVLMRISDRWVNPELPELASASATAISVAAAEDQQVEFYWVGSAARYAGTIVHKWLQQIGEGRVGLESGVIASKRSTIVRWAHEMGAPPTLVDDICDRVAKSVEGIIGDEKGRWILQGKGFCELKITGVSEGEVESIIIDRIRIDDDGTHWVIDYKTSSHEGGDLAGFLTQESNRYRPQLQKYAALYGALVNQSVRTALYFPLLQEFCEVSVD